MTRSVECINVLSARAGRGVGSREAASVRQPPESLLNYRDIHADVRVFTVRVRELDVQFVDPVVVFGTLGWSMYVKRLGIALFKCIYAFLKSLCT